MEVLVQIVKNLLMIIIIASFLELLMPDGNLKPFARWAMGLFILVAVLNPVLNLLYSKHELKINLWDYEVKSEQEEQILSAGKKINRQINTSDQDVIKAKLEGQIGAMAMLVPGVEEVKTEAVIDDRGAVKKISLKVIPGNSSKSVSTEKIDVFSGQEHYSSEVQNEIKGKIVKIIHSLYGMDNVDIDINFAGG